ncbi:hypothetical protein ABIA22_002857 [Sinorhizobium fredii]
MGGRTDEAGDKEVCWPLVEVERRADLLDVTQRQDNDAVGERHRLDLVVGDIDHRRIRHALAELGDLDAGGDAQRRVEVGQRLVEEEDLWVAADRPADRDTLALSAGERLRKAVEILGKLEHLCGRANAAVDLLLRFLGDPHAERHVVVDGHMRVERIGLEHHGDAALRWRHLVDPLAVDEHVAAGDLLQPGDHPEQRRLPAAGRPDEDDELALLDVEIDAVNDIDRPVGLADVFKQQTGHCTLPSVF